MRGDAVAAAKRPSYLKRQKEQQRLARAAEKREARRNRKHSKGAQLEDPEAPDQARDGVVTDEEAGP
jgi:hypothetical protein